VRRNLHIAELSQWINEQLDALDISKRYDKVVIIAHSMGGLIAREIILLKTLHKDQQMFGLLMEVASPHNGANFTKLASILGVSAPYTEEMQSDSSFLATLQTQWGQLPKEWRPETHCYTSPQDDVVPKESALFQCDWGHPHPQWGHTDLVKPDSSNDPRYNLPMVKVAQFFQNPSGTTR
jgi:triacylglycerol esterase/lipase EstA (alpha/beta hydrolase family)